MMTIPLRLRHITNRIALLLIVLLSTACNYDTLYSNLDEKQANEMLALLLQSNIDAEKSLVNKEWALKVSRNDLPAAVNLLKANGYPKENYESLGNVFKKEGFVSSPLEERARLLHALSQELSKTISEIDGVIIARVHLAIPNKEVLEENHRPSSASIFIKHKENAKVESQISSIKALVVNSVEGLPYDNVTVTLFATDLYSKPVKKAAKAVQSSGFAFIQSNYLYLAVAASLAFLLLISLVLLKRYNSRR